MLPADERATIDRLAAARLKNGPAFEAAWTHPDLLIKTVQLMQPVYALLEVRKLTPDISRDAEEDIQGTAETSGTATGAKKQKPKPKKPQKRRGIVGWRWGDLSEGRGG